MKLNIPAVFTSSQYNANNTRLLCSVDKFCELCPESSLWPYLFGSVHVAGCTNLKGLGAWRGGARAESVPSHVFRVPFPEGGVHIVWCHVKTTAGEMMCCWYSSTKEMGKCCANLMRLCYLQNGVIHCSAGWTVYMSHFAHRAGRGCVQGCYMWDSRLPARRNSDLRSFWTLRGLVW